VDGNVDPALCSASTISLDAEHAFYGWRQRLRVETPVTFALVETKQRANEAVFIEVVLTQGDRLRIPGDEATLRLVLGVLREQR
jgi:hypothetical protein